MGDIRTHSEWPYRRDDATAGSSGGAGGSASGGLRGGHRVHFEGTKPVGVLRAPKAVGGKL